MPGPTAVLDACTLYSGLRRDVLLWAAEQDLYAPRWSDQIHEEWIQNLLIKSPHLDAQRIARTRALMDEAFEEALVPPTAYAKFVPGLQLPDPGDAHVLALAIATAADVIVTLNLKDFPRAALPESIEARHPDDFLVEVLSGSPVEFCEAMRECRRNMRNPPRSVREFLEAMAGNLGELPRLSEALQPFSSAL